MILAIIGTPQNGLEYAKCDATEKPGAIYSKNSVYYEALLDQSVRINQVGLRVKGKSINIG